MAKITKANIDEPEEHPEDRASRLEGIAWAATAIDGFFKSHQKQFIALIQTYHDDEAHGLLDQLRERFWSKSF